VGEAECVLADGENVTPPLSITAYLADTDEIPPVMGFTGLLDRFRININYLKEEAYIGEE
jgi:hypothetical protein